MNGSISKVLIIRAGSLESIIASKKKYKNEKLYQTKRVEYYRGRF
jgi:hypothetical protein